MPRANTMVVCGAERFGLAQLHQLRGRVGRGRHQGLCYLMTSADHANTIHTDRRLSTLARLDRLGSGLAISAQDLDSRGSGDLLGDDQAGHLQLIGLGLFQHLLQRAIRRLNGEQDDDWAPELHVGDAGRFDETYIPEPDVRLNLYARLARAADAHECDTLLEEVEDRFGPLPSEAMALFTTARLRCLCHEHHVARLDAGPRGVALTPCQGLKPESLVSSLDASRRAGARIKAGRLLVTKAEAARSDTTLDWTLHLLEPRL